MRAEEKTGICSSGTKEEQIRSGKYGEVPAREWDVPVS
jgi:hypothetical protein